MQSDAKNSVVKKKKYERGRLWLCETTLSLTKIVLSNSPVNDLRFIDTIRTLVSLSATPQSRTHRQIGGRVTATKSSSALDGGGTKKRKKKKVVGESRLICQRYGGIISKQGRDRGVVVQEGWVGRILMSGALEFKGTSADNDDHIPPYRHHWCWLLGNF